MLSLALIAPAQDSATNQPPNHTAPTTPRRNEPPRVVEARRFLAQRGRAADRRILRPLGPRSPLRPRPLTAATAAWQAIGPTAVTSPSYGLVTGRVSALALDPSDPTGNLLYLGATGGGVWVSHNAGSGNQASVEFLPLTDSVAALSTNSDASISIGALTVQPGGTGVILAGTGDPNDALDSYYGAGILRSANGGNTWSLIGASMPLTGVQRDTYSFAGEGFAGFAWSTIDPQLVVAAVSQAYEATLVNAETPQASYEGLYYSKDGGVTWQLATISDAAGQDVQGPLDAFAQPDGNAATSVVFNPVRQYFVAAVRFHGYYQSPDGITWTRLASQPGPGLTSTACPTNTGSTGSPACPIFRGTLAVNPLTGDTFAWTVDENNQDQGLWQDQCAISGAFCTNQTIQFAHRLSTAPLESNTPEGPATIENGDYNLALAAVPSQQDTLLLAGANDLWKCSLANSCAWRNTTNANTCMSAQVGGYQHALAFDASNPLEVFVGNDSGIWRSTDAIGETGQVCDAADATHFQNLNGALGSLAEVESLAHSSATPYAMMLGLGANGVAGVKSAGPVADWPTVLGGEGGPVAIDPVNNTSWYANNQAGVSIHACSQTTPCTPAAFGASPAVSDADVDGDGLTMTTPAPFLVDPLDRTQLLIGTCRVWRGPAGGVGWSGANAISPILDGNISNLACDGDALIRSIAALPTSATTEVIYVGMYGALDGGDPLAGRVYGATIDPSNNASPTWQPPLSSNPVTNDPEPMNASGLDISSIFVDPHDATGNTVYLTVEGDSLVSQRTEVVYGSTDGGAHWANLSSNLRDAPASSIVVDPQDANTVYIATDDGVFSTRQIATCATSGSDCWTPFGTGLPLAPVVSLSAMPSIASTHVLIAGTYGRGAWQVPLWTAGATLTTGTVSTTSLAFPTLAIGTPSAAQTVTMSNTGAVALSSSISVTGDFSETDNCQAAALNEGAKCAIQVTFTPSQAGSRTGVMTISANVPGGQFTVALSGTGVTAGAVNLLPGTVAFGQVPVGSTSAPLQITASNTGGTAVPLTSVSISAGAFSISSNACGSQLAAGASCQLKVVFAPTTVGAASATVTMVDGAGTQKSQLTGTGAALATDTLTPSSLAFANTVTGQLSAVQQATLTNSGDLTLTGIAVKIGGPFQLSQSTCGGQLPGHSSCAIGVEFAPTQLGAQTGTLTVTDAIRQQTVGLSGTAVKPGAFGLSASSLTFTLLKVGVASPPQTLTIANTGGAAIANVGFEITGAAAASFSWSADTCGAALNPASQCTVQVTFKPAATGGSAATLTISSSSVGVTQGSVALSGTGTASGITVSPTQLTFAALSVGQSSPAQTVTIGNAAGLTLASLNLAVSAQFSLMNDTCPASLANGASCSVGVVFAPVAAGPVAGALTVTSPSFATPATVSLSATGATAPAILLQPQVLTFGQIGVGLSSTPQQVTVTNPGTLTAVSNLSFKAAGDFQLTGNTCTATLAPGASCTISVAFAPTASGGETGTLTASSANVPSAYVSLSGRGFDFTVTPTGVVSQTVSNGQTALYVLSIATLNGSQGSFTFQCGPLPPNAQCAFSPPSEGVTANATGSVTVEIATGVSASASTRSLDASRWPAAPLACGLLLLPLALKKRRKALQMLVLIAIAAGYLSSCLGASGGGTTHHTGTGVTPPGTYSIPVTVTSTGVSHSLTVSLTVD